MLRWIYDLVSLGSVLKRSVNNDSFANDPVSEEYAWMTEVKSRPPRPLDIATANVPSPIVPFASHAIARNLGGHYSRSDNDVGADDISIADLKFPAASW